MGYRFASILGKGIYCINKNETLQHAYYLMKDISTHHLPVVDSGNNIIGMLSERDILKSMKYQKHDKWSALEDVPEFYEGEIVEEHMSWPIQFIEQSASISQAADLLIEKKISALVVTHDKEPVGILTSNDLLRIIRDLPESELPSTIKSRLLSRSQPRV